MAYRYKKKFPLEPTRRLINDKNSIENTTSDIFNIGKQTYTDKKEGVRHFPHQMDSDVFNQKQNPAPKVRVNPTNSSSVFNSMQNNEQYSKEIKEYSNSRRTIEEKYNPDPYYSSSSAFEKKMLDLYGDDIF